MSRSFPDTDELLTGLLDGQLDASERAELERRMAEDGSIQHMADALAVNRRVVSSIPVRTTRPLASDVIAAASKKAAAMGANAPSWIPIQQSAHRPTSHVVSRWTMRKSTRAAVGFATAASILFVALSAGYWFQSDAGSQARPESGQLADSGANVSNPSPQSDGPESKPLREETSPFDVAANNPSGVLPKQTDAPEVATAPPSGVISNPSGESAAGSGLVAGHGLGERTDGVDSMVGTVPGRIADDEIAGMEAMLGSGLLLIVDVSVAEDVNSLEVLNDVLLKYDIASGTEIAIQQDTIDTLEKSRLVEGPVEAKRNEKVAQETTLVFVKSRASRLDSAILELMVDVDAFPEFSFDLAMDPPSLDLFQQLRFIQEAALSQQEQEAATRSSIATPITPSASQNSWVASSRRQAPMPIEIRKSSESPASALLMGEAGNPVVYALFVVRNTQ